MMNRYSRQIALPQLGKEGQERLSRSSVLCIGVGGLGSPASLYLAAAGVGRLGLIDADSVALSNLQRQILYRETDAGASKVSAAAQTLRALNPTLQIDAMQERFTDRNALSLVGEYDVILDGSDNFETKFLVNDAAFKAGKPLVYGAVNGFEGQVALFASGRGACYRCLHPHRPVTRIQNCAEAGVLGSVVGTLGTLQATLALQLLISGGQPDHPLYPEHALLTLLDFAGAWRFDRFKVPQREDCPTCSRPKKEIVLNYEDPACAISPVIQPDRLAQLLATLPSSVLLLDVRNPDEWAEEGHLENALLWPLSRLENGELPPIPPEAQEVVIYCRSGVRSAQGARILLEAGIRSSMSLAGGILAWTGPLSR